MNDILPPDRVYPRLKPEFSNQARNNFKIRMRTPEEQKAYQREREEEERKRTKGWLICVCCQKPRPQEMYHIGSIVVCDGCVHRGSGYGRVQGRVRAMRWDNRAWEINAAMAIIRAIEWEMSRIRWVAKNQGIQTSQPILTLPNSQRS